MRTAGIICEYNPFHFGHQLQIEKTRARFEEEIGIICLMSGNYVQRGEPAVFSKWKRAEAAVRGGADLVLELPVTIAVNAAGYFAAGGVRCLYALGCVDAISFGSECGDLTRLRQAAQLLDSEELETALQTALQSGCSYAAARTRAMNALGGDGGLLESPNNALAVEYLRELRRLESKMKPITIPRDGFLASASEIRGKMKQIPLNEMLPAAECYHGETIHTLKNGEKAMLAVLRSLPEEAFRNMAFEAEGLWSKVMKMSRREKSVMDIMMACKSKRYALSRLRRTLLCLFLGLDAEIMRREIPYLRVLGFNDRGREILRTAADTSAVPLVSGNVPKTPAAREYFEMESRVTDLYGLFAPDGVEEPCGRERWEKPFYLKM